MKELDTSLEFAPFRELTSLVHKLKPLLHQKLAQQTTEEKNSGLLQFLKPIPILIERLVFIQHTWEPHVETTTSRNRLLKLTLSQTRAHSNLNLLNMQEMKPQKAELLKKLEVGLIPDEELKCLIRAQLERRVLWINSHNCEQRYAHLHNHVQSLRPTSVEMETNELNTDGYDGVSIALSKLIHGRAMKMSIAVPDQLFFDRSIKTSATWTQEFELLSWCYFEAESTPLDDAEVAMLDLYCERAQIKDGDQVLDIGCGYGSLVIYIARKYPNCHVTGITDTASQKEYIVEQCRNQNLNNVEVILADVTEYNMDKAFDRVMVIEVFEHIKNYEVFLKKISKWMTEDGLLFVEHICHRIFPYLMKPLNEDDWIEEIIFPDMTLTIPSADFLLYFQTDVSVVNHWVLNGKHVARSSEVWLKRLDANADTAKAVVEAFTGCEKEAMKCINYARAFFLHGIEQGGYNNGEEWLIAHILFKK